MMGIPDWGRLSLGEWVSMYQARAAASGHSTVAPPSEADFDAAVKAARGG
jgi:hypothetical protein